VTHGTSAEKESHGAKEDRWPKEVDRQEKDDRQAEDHFAEAVHRRTEGRSNAEA
jgi:hypothetical protein